MKSSDIVARRLGALGPLSDATQQDLATLGPDILVPAGQELVAAEALLRPRFVVSGWAVRFRDLADGRRQIVGFVLPGEGMGLCERPGPLASSPVVALTPLRYVDARPIVDLAYRGHAPDLKNALLTAAALDEAWLMDSLVRLGRQSAVEALSHLFLELRDRLQTVGLVEGDGFAFPLTQEQMGDALGLSAVHVNRTLQNLRADGLITLAGGRLRILRPKMLEAIAEYAPVRVAQEEAAAPPGFPHRPLSEAGMSARSTVSGASRRAEAEALRGRRILVVEDEYMIAQDLQTAIEKGGGEVVGPVSSVDRALELLSRLKVDMAVLDVNLAGDAVWPLADALRASGVRFVLATGYDRDALPERYADIPRYDKPVDLHHMIAVLSA